MAKQGADDFDEWATAPRRKTNRCSTCQLITITELVDRFLEMRLSGKSGRSLADLHQKLKDDYQYEFSQTALNKHIRQCRREQWDRIRHERV